MAHRHDIRCLMAAGGKLVCKAGKGSPPKMMSVPERHRMRIESEQKRMPPAVAAVMLPGASPLTAGQAQTIEQEAPAGTLVARRVGPRSAWKVRWKGREDLVAEIRPFQGMWKPFVFVSGSPPEGPTYAAPCDALAYVASEIGSVNNGDNGGRPW